MGTIKKLLSWYKNRKKRYYCGIHVHRHGYNHYCVWEYERFQEALYPGFTDCTKMSQRKFTKYLESFDTYDKLQAEKHSLRIKLGVGSLVLSDSKKPYGLESNWFWKCSKCNTEYIELNGVILCNHQAISKCPYCD